jgi:LEA14-like dessication related protein
VTDRDVTVSKARLATLAFGLLAVAALPGPGAVQPEGKIVRLDVNSVTRKHAAAWLKARLPAAAKGSRQSFTGTFSIGSAPIPVKQPITVMVQPVEGGVEAVFLLELDLDRVTDGVVSNLGGEALAFSLAGTVAGESGSRAPVAARGSLRIGGPEIHAPSGEAAAFVRFGGARLSGLSLTETKGEATLVVFNPLGSPLGIEEIRYALSVNGRTVAEGSRSKVRLHPGRDNELALPVVARNSDLLSAAGDAAVSGGTVSGRLTGSVTVKTGTSRRVVAVDLPGTVNLIR